MIEYLGACNKMSQEEATEKIKNLDREEYISQAGLKKRGWTAKAIVTLLGDCDKTTPNPRYYTAAPMKLYLKERVEEAEKNDYFKKLIINKEKRAENARKAVETKKKNLLAKVSRWNIELEKMPYDHVVANAIKSYKQFHIYSDINFKKCDTDFLNRISVNYLRHELSSYDLLLMKLFGDVGKEEAYDILNQKIYDKIAECYPALEKECQKQKERKNIADP